MNKMVMTRNQLKENTYTMFSKMFKDLRAIYPKGYSSRHIYDHYITCLIKLDNCRTKTEVQHLFIKTVNYISNRQSEIAIHNLRKEGL